MNNGWIKIYRSMRQWGWYQDVAVKVLWLHILLCINRENYEYMGRKFPAGSFTTSTAKLANETGLSEKQVRLALSKLEKTGEIITNRANKYTLINAVKWADYQVWDDTEGTQKCVQKAGTGASTGTQERASRGKPLIVKQEDKKIRREEDIYRTTKPTLDEVAAYCAERHNNVNPNKWYDYYSANGWKVGKNPMKDWKACVRTWERSNDTHNSESIPTYSSERNRKLSEDELNELLSLGG